MGTTYEQDIVKWAQEQAYLLRAGKLSALDIPHLAEEIEDVGKSEQRELAARITVLWAHLLKWQYQPSRRGASWQRTIKEQRRGIAKQIERTLSLRAMLTDQTWQEEIWADAVAKAIEETGLDVFPESCPWPVERSLSLDFYPA